jgi:hypothetical protein
MDNSAKHALFAKRAPDAAAAAADEPASKRAKVTPLSVTPPNGAATVMVAPSRPATAITLPLSAAQRCDQDSLSVVFSFCQELRVVVAASQTCRCWRAIATRRQSCCHAQPSRSFQRATFLELLRSPLRCHLTGLTLRDVLVEDLLQLHGCCPQLEVLDVMLSGPWTAARTKSAEESATFNARAWPPSLRSLSIGCRGVPIGVQEQLLNAIPFSAIGLQSFRLTWSNPRKLLDFTPLLHLPQLTSLSTHRLLWRRQSVVVKQLCTLTELDIRFGCWPNMNYLHAVCDEPHQLQRLEKLHMHYLELNTESVLPLRTLPSLTELEPRHIDPECFALLHLLPNLRKLWIYPYCVPMEGVAVKGLLSSLHTMSHLTTLTFHLVKSAPAQWGQLFDELADSTPQLRKLTLYNCSRLPLRAWKIAGPQLRRLDLCCCDFEGGQDGNQPRGAFAQWTHSLRTLERVHLCRSYPTWIAAQMWQQAWPFVVNKSSCLQEYDD